MLQECNHSAYMRNARLRGTPAIYRMPSYVMLVHALNSACVPGSLSCHGQNWESKYRGIRVEESYSIVGGG